MVHSFVDYASAVWAPHQKFNQDKLEMMQRSLGLRGLSKVGTGE